MVVDSRTVHLPLSWDDPSTRDAIERYMRVVRDDAPWCPWNIEFIRRINGLDIDRRRCATSCSTPSTSCSASATCTSARRWRCRSTRGTGSSPRSTTRPARGRRRTRSASAARTCASTAWRDPAGTSSSGARCRCGAPTGGRGTRPREEPWLLRCFDRIRWYPVGADELLELRADANAGRLDLRIDDGSFSRAEHRAFLARHEPDIARFRAQREGAFAEERARWEASGEFTRGNDVLEHATPAGEHELGDLPDGAFVIEAPLHGSVARLLVAEGDRIAPDDAVATLEAMKTESWVRSPVGGTVLRIVSDVGALVAAGAPLVVVVTDG